MFMYIINITTFSFIDLPSNNFVIYSPTKNMSILIDWYYICNDFFHNVANDFSRYAHVCRKEIQKVML